MSMAMKGFIVEFEGEPGSAEECSIKIMGSSFDGTANEMQSLIEGAGYAVKNGCLMHEVEDFAGKSQSRFFSAEEAVRVVESFGVKIVVNDEDYKSYELK